MIRDRKLAKGDVLEVARLAGIMAAKRTGRVDSAVPPVAAGRRVGCRSIFPDDTTVAIEAEARATARTGVEMEALVAVSIGRR